MTNIDTRPLQIGTATAYRENSLPLQITVEGGLQGADVAVELQDSSGLKLYPVLTYEVIDNIVYVNFTKEQVAKMPAIAFCIVILNGVYSNGFKIVPQRGFGIPQNTSATIAINLKGDKGETGDITPEAAALALQINNQALQVEADTEAVDLSAQQVEAARQQVASDKVVVQQESGVASDMADSAIAAKNTAVAAKIEAVESKDIVVTKAAEVEASRLAAKASEDNAALFGTGSQTAIPTDIPNANVKLYNVSTAGTYTNFGGIVVSSGDLSSGLVQLRNISNAWSKMIVPVDGNASGRITKIEDKLPLPNKFNPSTGTDGFIINSNGSTAVNANYGYSEYYDVAPGEVYTTWDGVHGSRRVNFYNASKVNVANIDGTVSPFAITFAVPSSPSGIVYMRVTYYIDNKASFMLRKSSAITPFVPFGISESSNIITPASSVRQTSDLNFVSLAEKALYASKLGTENMVVENSSNLFNAANGVDNFYLSGSTVASSATYGYGADYIAVSPGDILSGSDGSRGMRVVTFYDIDKVYKSQIFAETFIFTVPADVRWVRVSYYKAGKSTFRLNKGDTLLEFEPYGTRVTSLSGNKIKPKGSEISQEPQYRMVTDVEKATWNSKTDYNANAVLPSRLYAVVGIESNLYYDAFTLFPEYAASCPNFLFEIICSKGKMGRRSFRVTPSLSDIGEYPLTFNLLDSLGNTLQTVSTILSIIGPYNPARATKILMISDSTGDTGYVSKALQANLSAFGGNVPVFLGQHQVAPYKNEARTGKRYYDFAIGATVYKVYFSGVNPALNISNIRNAYYYHNTTSNQIILSERWKINPDGSGWAIGYNFSPFTAPSNFPATLTAKTAALADGFPSALNVTNVEMLTGFSIFKNNDGIGSLDINFYRTQVLGLAQEDKIDSPIFDLGINDVGTTIQTDAQITAIVNNAKLLVNAFLVDNPSCKPIICLPKSICSDCSDSDRKPNNLRISIHKLRKAIIREFDQNAAFPNVLVSHCGYGIDRYYGYPMGNISPASRIPSPVFTEPNSQNTTTTYPLKVISCLDDVHPTEAGSGQVADVLTGCVVKALA